MTGTGPLRALIVDDEAGARGYLRRLLGSHPEIVVEAEAETLDAAPAVVRNSRPDLIFLDIHLGPENGFELIERLDSVPGIVFVSAFADYAIRAFEVNALNYLLKPVRPDRLARALAPLLARDVGPPGRLAELPDLPALRFDDRVVLRGDRRQRVVRLVAFTHILAAGNYSEVGLRDGSLTLVRHPLQAWAEALPAAAFLRLDRSLIVALPAVQGVRRLSRDEGELWLLGHAAPVPLGRVALMQVARALATLPPKPHGA